MLLLTLYLTLYNPATPTVTTPPLMVKWPELWRVMLSGAVIAVVNAVDAPNKILQQTRVDVSVPPTVTSPVKEPVAPDTPN